MKDLLEKLGPEARRRVLMGQDDSEDSDDGDESGDESTGWGRKKSTYYSADTADLEIGQDAQDADDEEIAATVISIMFDSRVNFIALSCRSWPRRV